MAEKRWRTWETMGLLVVLAAGNLLHFVYDWTGQSPIAAPLAAVNESTWEHMKLFITPWVLWSLVECIALQGHGSLLPARGLGLLTGLTAIPALFYTYQGILGRGIMWVDVLIFQLAVLLAFWVSWSVQARRVLDGPVWQILGGVTLLDVLREHLDELDRGKPVYVNCQTGLRSYLSCRLLTQHGFTCTHLSGGYSFYQVITQERQTAQSTYPCGMETV